MASEELEKSLRAEIENHIESRLSQLQTEVSKLRSKISEEISRTQDTIRGEFSKLSESIEQSGNSEAMVLAISEHLQAARKGGMAEGAAEAPSTRAASGMAILKAGINDVSQQNSQAAILKTLVNHAASFAPRVAFFVVKNEHAMGWRARGLAGTVGDDAIKEIAIPLSSNTLLSEAAHSQATQSGVAGSNSDDSSFISKFGGEAPLFSVAIPLVARGRSVAVLYADSAQLDADAIDLAPLEALVRVTGMAVELLAGGFRGPAEPAGTAPEAIAAPPVPPAPPVPAYLAEPEPVAYAPAAAYEPPAYEPAPAPAPAYDSAPAATAPAYDTSPAYQEPAPTYEDSMPHYDPAPAQDHGYDTAPPVYGEVAQSGYAEAAPAFPEPAPILEESPAPTIYAPVEAVATAPAPALETVAAVQPAGGTGSLERSRSWSRDTELPVEVGEEERRLHNDARRFARLLVSEIKLYNEQKVREGRETGDIYPRLQEAIDRSREMYDKRAHPSVVTRYDYFHHELVNTLADGDSGRMGDGYPGSTA